MMKSYDKYGAESIINLHKKHFVRIYPSAKHLSSTNYNPVYFWMLGCQIVALNYQTCDIGMILNKGMFIENGCCGYVLKPSTLRDFNSTINPF